MALLSLIFGYSKKNGFYVDSYIPAVSPISIRNSRWPYGEGMASLWFVRMALGSGTWHSSKPGVDVLLRKTGMRSLADGQSLAIYLFGIPQGRPDVRSDLVCKIIEKELDRSVSTVRRRNHF